MKTDIIVTGAADQTTGAVTYWKLSGDIALEALTKAWTDAGLSADLLPPAVSPSTALQRAVYELRSPSTLVRKHPKGGWAIVTEAANSETLEYNVGAHLFLENDDLKTSADADAGLVEKVSKLFQTNLASLSTTDISNWLVSLARRYNSVLLRESGGIYFTPRTTIERWNEVMNVVNKSTNHVVYEIPAVQSAEVVAAVYDAVQQEALAEIAALEKELDAEGIRAQTLVDRLAHCDTVIAKVQSFEKLLNKPVGNAIEQLQALKLRIRSVVAVKDKSGRFAQLEIDQPLTDEEKAVVKANSDKLVAEIQRRKAALEAPTTPVAVEVAAAGSVEEKDTSGRFGLLEID